MSHGEQPEADNEVHEGVTQELQALVAHTTKH